MLDLPAGSGLGFVHFFCFTGKFSVIVCAETGRGGKIFLSQQRPCFWEKAMVKVVGSD